MKRIFLILLLTLITGGCESRKTTNKIGSNKPFPKALVGAWEGYYSEVHWVVKFTPDGNIEYAKIPFGGQFVSPNSEAVFPMQGDNNTMVVKTGQFIVDYNPNNSSLGVSIEIINIDANTPAGRMEMNGVEYLMGDIDLDKGIWEVVWFTDGSYWLTPLGENRVKLPDEDDGGKPMILKRLIRKDDVKREISEK